MARPFFQTTFEFRAQHTALFDFVHPTAAAIWNTRWQVRGYLDAVPTATRDDLEHRFVLGSGVDGANIRRAFAEWQWEDHTSRLAQVVLVNIIALYEGWLDETLRIFEGNESKRRALAKKLQFPSEGVGRQTKDGIRDALQELIVTPSPIWPCFRNVLQAQSKYQPAGLDELMLIFRKFKELRNDLTHHGATVSQATVDAAAAAAVDANDFGMKHLPEAPQLQFGDAVQVSLRGAIGFAEVVRRIVDTIDVELAAAGPGADDLLARWQAKYGRRVLAADPDRRSSKVASMTTRLGLPPPDDVGRLVSFLKAADVIF